MVIWKVVALLLLGAFLTLAALFGMAWIDERASRDLYALKRGCRDPSGNPDDIIVKCTELIERYPRSRAEGYSGRGMAYFRKGDYDRAILEYSQAINLEPADPFHHSWRASAYERKGDTDRAMEDYDQSIRVAPDRAHYYRSRGRLRFDKRDFEGALADFDRAISLEPYVEYTYYLRADTHASMRNWDGVIADSDAIIQRKPRAAAAYSQRGNAYAEKRDFERAQADWRKALAVDPSLAGPKKNLKRIGVDP